MFSGFDPQQRAYDPTSWQYEGAFVAAASGQRDQEGNVAMMSSARDAGQHQDDRGTAKLDMSLQHPRCVWQILKRHYAGYTPEMVERICGIPQDVFLKVCRLFVEHSGRERTTSFVYGVGWTQHTIGSQYIRCASMLQLLLGNVAGRGAP